MAITENKQRCVKNNNLTSSKIANFQGYNDKPFLTNLKSALVYLSEAYNMQCYKSSIETACFIGNIILHLSSNINGEKEVL